jgi:hypothetical protein
MAGRQYLTTQAKARRFATENEATMAGEQFCIDHSDFARSCVNEANMSDGWIAEIWPEGQDHPAGYIAEEPT